MLEICPRGGEVQPQLVPLEKAREVADMAGVAVPYCQEPGEQRVLRGAFVE